MNDEIQLPVYTIDGKRVQLRNYGTITIEDEDKLLAEDGAGLKLKGSVDDLLKTILVPLDRDENINYRSISQDQLTEIIVDFMLEKNRFLASMGERFKSLMKQKQGH